ncbi:YjfI family protein [Lysobacter humi (ex Lee et al. 2017)]
MTECSTRDLYEQLIQKYEGNPQITVQLIDSSDPAINVTMHEYGDMQVVVAASGSQIFVSTILVDASQVKDRAGFNEACMRINPINPLSNLGLTQIDGRDTYIVFGELSAASCADDVDEELQALAINTIDAAESLKSFFA